MSLVLSGLLVEFGGINADSGRDPRSEALTRSFGTAGKRLTRPLTCQIQLTKCGTSHCFLVFSEYIASQRVRCARSYWPGFLFGAMHPAKFSFLSVTRKQDP